jgi:preprotein translocase subunit SecD
MPIINITVVSAVISGLLLIFSKGVLYGFAVTFGIGTLVSIVASALFTRLFAVLILPLAKNNEAFFVCDTWIKEGFFFI